MRHSSWKREKKPNSVNSIKEKKDILKNGLVQIYDACILIKNELVPDLKDENEIEVLSSKLSNFGDEFNRILESLLDEEYAINDKVLLLKAMQVQGVINKTAHKIQRIKTNIQKANFEVIKQELDQKSKKIKENGDGFLKKATKLEDETKKLEDESKKMKESILTITTLVFTAFTLIQINSTSFQNTKDYLVIDRLILFSGINIFVALNIYIIFALIRTIILNDKQICKHLKIRLIVPLVVLTGIFGFLSWRKHLLESDHLYKTKIKYYEDLISKNREVYTEMENELVKLNVNIDKVNLRLAKKRIELEDITKNVEQMKLEVEEYVTVQEKKILEKEKNDTINQSLENESLAQNEKTSKES